MKTDRLIRGSLNPLLVNPVQGEATWNNISSGVPWNTVGAGGSGTDFNATPAATVVAADESGVWIEFDITAYIDALVNAAANNYGLLFNPSGSSNPFELVLGNTEGTNGERLEVVIDYTAGGGGSATTITDAASSAGADTAALNEQLTLTVADNTGVTGVSVNGVALSNVVADVDGVTVTADLGLGVNANIGASVNVIVNNGTASAGYPVTVALPAGFSSVVLTAAYADLPLDSSFYGESAYSTLDVGDVWIYDNIAGTITYDSELVVTADPALVADTDVDGWFLEASESYAADASITTDHLTVADTTPPVITRLGSATVNVTQGTSYVDAGATAADNVDGDITANIVVNNPVNTAVLGQYTVTYNVSDAAGNAAVQVTRTVNVVAAADVTPPVITLVGSAVVSVNQNDSYVDAGATATDNVDGDITGDIVVNNPVNTAVLGQYTVTYNVSDAAGNAAVQVTRTVNVVEVGVDVTPPVITLIGSAAIYVNVGDTYLDAGATAVDDIDGDITGSIVVNNPVNTAVVGSYSVTYNVSDAEGNAAAQVTRLVTVLAANSSPGMGFASSRRDNSWRYENGRYVVVE